MRTALRIAVIGVMAVLIVGCAGKNPLAGGSKEDVALKEWSILNHDGLEELSKGNNQVAEQKFLEALRLAERYGPEDLRVAATLNNLASVYEKKGMVAESIPLMRRSATIFEHTYGPDYAGLGVILANLGRVYGKQRDFEESLAFYERAIKVMGNADRPNKDQLADAMDGYAEVLKKQSRFDEARDYERQAREIRRTGHYERPAEAPQPTASEAPAPTSNEATSQPPSEATQ